MEKVVILVNNNKDNGVVLYGPFEGNLVEGPMTEEKALEYIKSKYSGEEKLEMINWIQENFKR